MTTDHYASTGAATPLLWSHGMYLILADELGELGELDEVGATH